MPMDQDRRHALRSLGVAFAAAGATLAAGSQAEAAVDMGAPLLEPGASNLAALMKCLEKAPRRRDFKTVPMILTERSEWDDEALRETMACKAASRQV